MSCPHSWLNCMLFLISCFFLLQRATFLFVSHSIILRWWLWSTRYFKFEPDGGSIVVTWCSTKKSVAICSSFDGSCSFWSWTYTFWPFFKFCSISYIISLPLARRFSMFRKSSNSMSKFGLVLLSVAYLFKDISTTLFYILSSKISAVPLFELSGPESFKSRSFGRKSRRLKLNVWVLALDFEVVATFLLWSRLLTVLIYV